MKSLRDFRRRVAEPKPDEYVEFLVKLNKSNGKKYVLNISVDTNYSVSIGGVVASFGQYSDYPTKKSFNSVDITDFLKSGENEIIITAYYLGVAKYGTYALGEAGLIFDITETAISLPCPTRTFYHVCPLPTNHTNSRSLPSASATVLHTI